MNNKPYIWMDDLDTWFTDEDYQNLDDLLKKDMFPLYTHPAELTDEEIANTWDDVRKDATLKPSMKDMQDFARAILRKASEK